MSTTHLNVIFLCYILIVITFRILPYRLKSTLEAEELWWVTQRSLFAFCIMDYFFEVHMKGCIYTQMHLQRKYNFRNKFIKVIF